jgi:hypothetical protein
MDIDDCSGETVTFVYVPEVAREIQQHLAEQLTKTEHDPVNHPKHYVSHPSGVECIDITRHMGFNLGNVFKYVWRADLKHNAIEDLEKAQFYLANEIALRKEKEAK